MGQAVVLSKPPSATLISDHLIQAPARLPGSLIHFVVDFFDLHIILLFVGTHSITYRFLSISLPFVGMV